eukprot:TRINITY_DN21938_c0_g1_i3.p1 TRINITY_DN21938_c0_g1~~TRINITY_DN21938_c0_g1_i3.p1  ORF type:complete len:100 (-),score=34.33 TRINITY_DN21938_c0_g1_i3:252-551(-)
MCIRDSFYDYVESFEDLHGKSLEDQHLETMKKLRNQYLYDNKFEDKLCYRTCFKFLEKRHIEFCLERKCGTKDFHRAASVLGYVKSASTPVADKKAHHH